MQRGISWECKDKDEHFNLSELELDIAMVIFEAM